MFKRRLIALVTFLAGLYYFLEFIVPPTIPWQTNTGAVTAVTPTAVTLNVNGQTVTQPITPNTVVYRLRENDARERIEPAQLAPGDRASVGPTTYLTDQLTNVNNFFIVLVSLAWGVGLINLTMVHSANIRKRRPDWFGSVLFFIALMAGIAAGIGYGVEGGVINILGFGVPGASLAALNDTVFNYLIRPMSSTVFSLLAFHMATAAYRAFKVRSTEAALMMFTALIVMLGQIPIGLWLTGALPESMQLPVISQWVLYIANSAAVRGMWFGMMVGAIAVGLRFWLSLERGAFFDRDL